MGLGNFFKRFKKEDIIIDLGDLQKRGIIKQNEPSESESTGVVDLTESSNSSSNDGSSALGFLGALAGSGESSEGTDTISSPTSFVSDRKTKLKGIIRDMKGKVDNTYDKVHKLSDKLDLLEKKLERLERRAGF